MGSDFSPPSFQYKSKIVFSLNLEFVPPYVFLLNPDYDNNINNKQRAIIVIVVDKNSCYWVYLSSDHLKGVSKVRSDFLFA